MCMVVVHAVVLCVFNNSLTGLLFSIVDFTAIPGESSTDDGLVFGG